jgi:glycolate oxidase iron-sulfur subunit
MRKLPYDETIQCVQCGYCLPACPTYMTMGKETHSPRGRINLVKMAAEGRITIADMQESIDLCLGCRACETACPSGVEYGQILEGARHVLHEQKAQSAPVKWTQDVFFKKMMPNSTRLKQVANVLWLYQSTGLQKVVRKGKLSRILPKSLSAFEEVLPNLTSPKARRQRPNVFKPGEGIQTKWKVAFFTGCIMDAMFERINRLSMELLALAGCEVYVIKEQTCCGALHAHTGRMEESRSLAKQNIEAFEALDVDFIVNNAGGCGAALVEYGHLLAGDPVWEERAAAFARKNRDISQILSQCSLPYKNRIEAIVTYQRSCHMTNVQKVVNEPLALIKSMPGVTYKEMGNPHMCCGSAGIYNMVNYEESMEILDVKMIDAKATQATIIVTTNPGCLLQMQVGIQREGLSDTVRTVHLVELLAELMGLAHADEESFAKLKH